MKFSIEKLRQTDESVKNIILEGIEVAKNARRAKFTFINDAVLKGDTAEKIKAYLSGYLPEGYSAVTDFIKRTCDAEILTHTLYNLITENHPSLKAFIKKDDITARKISGGFEYCVRAVKSVHSYLEENNFLLKTGEFLQNTFCENITGELILKDGELKAKEILSRAAKKELFDATEKAARRLFKITNLKPLEGEISDAYAVYMSDCDFETAGLTVCGRILKTEERQTKKGKPYYLFELSDGTYEDGIRTFKAKMFPYLRQVDNAASLKEGDWVALSGKMEAFNGNLSLTIEKFGYARPPEGFVPEKLSGRQEPPFYINIHPQPYAELAQRNLFEKKKILPDDLVNNTFVVFDLETTGLNNNPLGLGSMDTVIEIGAVKIEGGVITHSFSTLVKPDRHITDEITKITGIDDKMVENSPPLNDVLPDFYKFTRGAYLVGHNVDFDYKFIRHYSKEIGYIYDNRAYDTVALSQELLSLSNNKLNTVAAHFGLEFNHHRALDDAQTTAKIFIELITARKCLPN